MSKKPAREHRATHTLNSAKADVLKALGEATSLLSALSANTNYFPRPEEITAEVIRLRRVADQFIAKQAIK